MIEKVIVISIEKKHIKNIESGKKKLELRKNEPNKFKGWVYAYETYGQQRYVTDEVWGDKYPEWIGYEIFKNGRRLITEGRGQIVLKWWHEETTKIRPDIFIGTLDGYIYEGNGQQKDLCLTQKEIEDYIKYDVGKAWHIKKLQILEEPMNLEDFHKDAAELDTDEYGRYVGMHRMLLDRIKHPPQSWQYAYKNTNLNEMTGQQ